MLTGVQKEQLEKSREAAGELSNLLEWETFINDFCLAVKIMAEVMDAMEMPDIDD